MSTFNMILFISRITTVKRKPNYFIYKCYMHIRGIKFIHATILSKHFINSITIALAKLLPTETPPTP